MANYVDPFTHKREFNLGGRLEITKAGIATRAIVQGADGKLGLAAEAKALR